MSEQKPACPNRGRIGHWCSDTNCTCCPACPRRPVEEEPS